MNQLDVLLNKEMQNEINPFGVQLEGPLHNQAATVRRAPKINDDGDIGTFGSRNGGGG